MDLLLTYLVATAGVITGAIIVKLYNAWQDRRERAKMAAAWNQFLGELEEAAKEEKKPPSDPEEPVDRPL